MDKDDLKSKIVVLTVLPPAGLWKFPVSLSVCITS